jgi:uncharacterized protein DUF4105
VTDSAQARRPGRLGRVLRGAGSAAVRLLLLLPTLFAFGAVLAPGGAVATALASIYGLGTVAVLILVRPLWQAAAIALAAFGAVIVWFESQEPRSDRPWQDEVLRAPRVVREGDLATVTDVRDFDWTGDVTANPRWRTESYDLSKLDSLSLVLSYWDDNTAICHTMLSFGFSDRRYLAVSVETRKEIGEEYSAWRGFFHQYELFYVLAEERDLIGVRAAHRAEDLYLYPLRTPPDARRRLLEDILAKAEGLAIRPEWYGALRTNCTTTLQAHVDQALGRPSQFHWDTMLNGSIDEVAWRSGAIAGDPPFSAIRAAHRITDAAKAAAGTDEFSRAIHAAAGR